MWDVIFGEGGGGDGGGGVDNGEMVVCDRCINC